MTRAPHAVPSHKKKKRILKQAKGFYGRASKCPRIARRSILKALSYQFRDRKNRKRDFRRLWIVRINAGLRLLGHKYSVFMNLLSKSDLDIDRKMLADLAMNEPKVFEGIVNKIAVEK